MHSSRLGSSLARLSTVHKGAEFEHRSRKILQEHLSMSLRCVGGRSDGGIDLIGWWWVPTNLGISRRRVRVLAQCKAEKRKPRPGYVRELEGVAQRFLATPDEPVGIEESLGPEEQQRHFQPHQGSVGPPIAAILVSESPFTRATLLRAYSSSVPFLLLHLPPERECGDDGHGGDGDEKMGAAFWNAALAGARGVLGGEVELRWERELNSSPTALREQSEERKAGRTSGRPGMWWRGRKVQSWTPEGEDGRDM